MMSRPTYRGLRRKIVLAFDLGTTYSGISYRYGFYDKLSNLFLMGPTQYS